MTVTHDRHAAHGATFHTRGDREIPAHYGRPDTAHRAVRNGVGVTEMPYDILEVTGPDRVEFIDATVTTTITDGDGTGVYALLLDPDGHTTAELYVYTAGDQLLAFLPPGTGADIGSRLRDRIIRRDVAIEVVTTKYGVFGVYGPDATEKIASVLTDAPAPEGVLSFDRGRIDDVGVTVVRTDNRPGEEGYEVICAATEADDVLDSLLVRGLNAPPFGHQTWQTLTLEAGTPLFESELRDRIPVGLVGGGYDRTKGCFPGQEVIARIEDRGRPPHQLVGLTPEELPEPGATVTRDGSVLGTVTRAVDSPILEHPIAVAILDYGELPDSVVVGGETPATVTTLPFLTGSARSTRVPPTE